MSYRAHKVPPALILIFPHTHFCGAMLQSWQLYGLCFDQNGSHSVFYNGTVSPTEAVEIQFCYQVVCFSIQVQSSITVASANITVRLFFLKVKMANVK